MQSVQLSVQHRAVEECRVDLKAKMPRTGPEVTKKQTPKHDISLSSGIYETFIVLNFSKNLFGFFHRCYRKTQMNFLANPMFHHCICNSSYSNCTYRWPVYILNALIDE